MSAPDAAPTPASNPSALPLILVADDNVDAVRVLVVLLRKEYTFIESFTVESTVAAIRLPEVDAVLLDLGFQGESSEKLVDDLVSRAPLPPIVLLTGRPVDELVYAREKLFPAAVLTKPAEPEAIRAALSFALSSREK